MVGGFWMDTDGLYRQYGTTKAVPETAGDFNVYGETRQQEYTIDLTTLNPNGTNFIISNTTFIPAGVYIESVEIDVEVAATGATGTLSVGLIGQDRTTVASATGFVAATMLGSAMTQGARFVLTPGVTGAGAYIGTTTGTPSAGYLIAQSGVVLFTTGKIKLRINYRTTSTITQ
jgi:hypothetical protein